MSSSLRKRDGGNDIEEQASVKQRKVSSDVSLNYDVLVHIFGLLDRPTLCAAAMVCKDWKMAAYCPLLWKDIVFKLDSDALTYQLAGSLEERGIKTIKAKATYEDEESFGRALVYCAEVVKCETLYLYDLPTDQALSSLFPQNFSSLKHLALVKPMLKVEKEGLERLLSPLVNIEQLYIRWRHDSFEHPHEYSEFIKILCTTLPKLKDLELVNDKFLFNSCPVNGLVCPRVEKLVVETNGHLVEGSLICLPGNFPGVKHLEITMLDFNVHVDIKSSFSLLESLKFHSNAIAEFILDPFIEISKRSPNLRAVDLTTTLPKLEDRHFEAVVKSLPHLSAFIYGHRVSLECLTRLLPHMKNIELLASIDLIVDLIPKRLMDYLVNGIQIHMPKLFSLLHVDRNFTNHALRLPNIRYVSSPIAFPWNRGILKRVKGKGETELAEVKEDTADWHEAVCSRLFNLPDSFDFDFSQPCAMINCIVCADY